MAFSYNIAERSSQDLPSLDHDVRRAKQYLQKHSSASGDSLYDHLTEIIDKILTERPKNIVDVFEQYSYRLKQERFKSKSDYLRDVYVPPLEIENAKKLMHLFRLDDNSSDEIENEEGTNDEDKKVPNMFDIFYYFEQTGVGLPRSEMVLLNLSIRQLTKSRPLKNIRFWGKILGNPRNYYVVEADLEKDELNRRREKFEADERARREKEEAEIENAAKLAADEAAREEMLDRAKDEAINTVLPVELQSEDTATEKRLNLVFPPLPRASWKPEREIPSEPIGIGVNKKTYFVCGSPGLEEWIELPSVTPRQIVVARQIIRQFTGNLDTPIYTFPTFPGTERNYLRAQIARISSATLISPIGWYNFHDNDGEEEIIEEEEEQEEEDEEEGGKKVDRRYLRCDRKSGRIFIYERYVGKIISKNRHYDPLPIKDLVEPSMSNWCHHSPHILKQGRTTWWNPSSIRALEEAEGEEEEGEEEDDAPDEEEEENEEEAGPGEKKEIGPSLLTPLSEDATIDGIPAWTARRSSFIQPDTAIASVRSNLWPGAFAFAVDEKFANVYIGHGHKFMPYNYSPTSMPPVQDQYKIGPEIMEILDPTFEQEDEWRIAHLPIPKPNDIGEKNESLEDHDDDDDDDDTDIDEDDDD